MERDGGMSFLFNPIARGVSILAGKGLKPFVRAQVDLVPEGASVLSIGAGGPVGEILEARAQDKGLNVTSFDIDSDRKPDIVGDITTYDFEGRSFDYIFMIEVLEHIPDVHKVPDRLFNILNDGGTLILSTPFIFPIHDAPHDYYRYTHYGLRHLFKEFQDLDIVARNSWAESINVLLARTYKEKVLSFRVLGAFMVVYAVLLQPLHWVMGKLFKSDFMTSGYMMVAKK